MAFNFITIMRLKDDGVGVGKYNQFETEAEADAHVAKFLDSFPNAYVAPHPGPSGLSFWVCDPVAKTVTVDTTAQTAGDDLRNWKLEIEATDKDMPRWFEDAVTDGSVILKPGRVKDTYDAKVLLRGQKP